MRPAILLTEQGEKRGEPESSQQTVPPELSHPGKCDMHNNALVPSTHIFIIKHIREWITIRTSDN